MTSPAISHPTVAATRVLPSSRIEALDGVRGVAAVIVVVYHYMCLLHPNAAPSMGASLVDIADTPVHLLWNGRFAVAVFFVLSGFVMAAAADRRRGALVSNCVARYLRLALPVAASCVLAWLWLTAFPDSAQTMIVADDNPSRWLHFTYQSPIHPVWMAVADGLAGNFVRGFSRFNNVLWTMKFELLGSLGLFLVYFAATGWPRIVLLLLSAAVVVAYLPDFYLAFVVGAGLYEAHQRDALKPDPRFLPVAALLAAVLLGSPGEGAHSRLDLPEVPEAFEVGEPRGFVSVAAAGLLLYAVLTLPALARIFATPLPMWLGRLSFGLYLVHVPPLYTIVAWAHVQGDLPGPVLGAAFFGGTLLLAWAFTLFVDEPILRQVSALRTRMSGNTVR